MADTLQSALLISAIGMGLVFGVILLLWGLIALIVRVGADRPVAGAAHLHDEAESAAGTAADRQRAPAVAVVTAVAVALERDHGISEAKAKAAAAAVGAYLASERRAR
jgi:Na+-transporting methylmalonyl-CoA/oxaloacetate decarboxylase gamma subunit